MVICSDLPVPFSSADTCKIPLASTPNDTSIWGTPRGAGGSPVSSNLPRRWLSFVIDRSPSYTWMRTAGWLSTLVENVWDFFVGIGVFRGIKGVNTPPTVSIPWEREVTSRTTISFSASSPAKTPPWIAAPYATASSGFTEVDGSFPSKNSVIKALTRGIRVEPPTSTISSTSDLEMPASSSARWTGPRVFLKRSLLSSSKRARVNVSEKSTPFTKSSISRRACCCDESARLVRSTSFRSFCKARLSPLMSTFDFFLTILM
mmetsp:Transcript_3712/g.8339  ORF Transcript_3712/g.8339 Transcript_3712/m.8339 type:complete len:261 (-) Transcript_3712:1699-2481(-)